jgi:hypothetical protein
MQERGAGAVPADDEDRLLDRGLEDGRVALDLLDDAQAIHGVDVEVDGRADAANRREAAVLERVAARLGARVEARVVTPVVQPGRALGPAADRGEVEVHPALADRRENPVGGTDEPRGPLDEAHAAGPPRVPLWGI